MYTKQVRVDKSLINGKGVFAGEDIAKNDIVWVFKDGYDRSITNDEFQKLPIADKDHLSHTAYLSPWSKLWVFPPKGDPAEYTNHSVTNNLSVKFDKLISSEPFFVANRNISSGDEITNNYYEFDEITRTQKHDWAE